MLLQNSNAIETGGYAISNSLRFQSASSQYLNRTFSNAATNNLKGTISAWVKRGTLGSQVDIISCYNGSSSASTDLYFNSSNQLQFDFGNTAANSLITSAVYRDPSSWYHVVISVDTTQATASNRVKIYVNGSQVTAFASATYPAQNTVYQIVSINANNRIGTNWNNSGVFFDGYIAEYNQIDGQALTPSSFGETNTLTGQWVAKKYTGTYGTNGFYLPFSNGTSTTTLGADSSGNGNNWTLNNFTRSAGVSDCWMFDVPSGNGGVSGTQPSSNYAVLNPLDTGGTAPLNGNLTLTAGAAERGVRSTFAVPTTGLYYAEAVVGTNQSGATDIAFGFVSRTTNLAAAPYNISNGWLIYGTTSTNITRNGTSTLAGAGTALVSGDILQIAIDLANNKGWVGKNNTWFNGSTGTDGNPSTGANPTFTFSSPPELFVLAHCYLSTINTNFGQRSFAYTPPTGFKALCTANLPASTIVKGNQYMDATTYSGNSTYPRTITNTAGFSPDLVWVKARSTTYSHILYDAVRGTGTGASLSSNETSAEGANSTYANLTAFETNGFTVGSTTATNVLNNSGQTFVAWQWDAGSSTVTNTSGSISSQVRANTTAGVSVVTYTGTGANATVGHGLGVAPKMVIVKNRGQTGDWCVYHVNMNATPQNYYMQLNLTSAAGANSTIWNNTAPTSTTFSIGSYLYGNTINYVAYCFSEIAGFSKFGSYTGNGSTDGPFCFTGFTPKLIMCKRTDAVSDWFIMDTARNPYNTANALLGANVAYAESTYASTNYVDFLSNGFKIRQNNSNGYQNASGGTYIYMAFAENPFANANAR